MMNEKIDQAIYESEQEFNNGAEPIPIDTAMKRLNKKYYGETQSYSPLPCYNDIDDIYVVTIQYSGRNI